MYSGIGQFGPWEETASNKIEMFDNTEHCGRYWMGDSKKGSVQWEFDVAYF
jgi:hypothetical protein